MKNFWPGLLIFLLYCMGCLLVLGYFLGDLKSDGVHVPALNDTVNKSTSISTNPIEITSLKPKEETTFKEDLNTIDTVVVKPSIVTNDSVSLSTKTDTKNDLNIEQTSTEYEALPFSVFNEAKEVLVPCNLFALIYENRNKVKIPYGCINYGVEIKKILSLHKESSLTITGYSSPEEPSTLGKQRAEYLKKLLVGIGIDRSRLHTNASFQDINYVNGKANGGILMRINNSDSLPITSSISTAPANKEITVQTTRPTGPYAYKKFTSGYQGDYFYGNQSFTSYVSQIKTYLKDNPSKKIEIYTYTDSVGNAIDNMSISKANSATAQRIVAQSGIPAYKIKSISMGEKAVDASGSSKCVILKVK
ncbi:OmpA family protein [Nonlabens xylanidelens]|nr:OmpA family protein [Nonlabens xylanidelens]